VLVVVESEETEGNGWIWSSSIGGRDGLMLESFGDF
jgi:hypothetical protein